jgi:hydrogenase maturation protease
MIAPAVDPVSGSAPVAGGPPPAVLVVGVGNLIMGDEGVGIHLLRTLENDPPVPGVHLLDGGTGGIILLEAIARAPVVVMVDATRDGQPAGTVSLLRPACVADLPRGLSAHDFGLRDLFAAAALLGQFPDIHLFTISVETINPMCLELTEPVAAAMPEVVRSVHALTHRLVAARQRADHDS